MSTLPLSRSFRAFVNAPNCPYPSRLNDVSSSANFASFTANGFTSAVNRFFNSEYCGRFAYLPLLLVSGMLNIASADQAVQFDLPATSAATLVTDDPTLSSRREMIVEAEKTVVVDFHLSTILARLSSPQIEQMVVQIKPLGGASLVVDYSPRTEFSSHFATDIAVCESSESSDHVGLGIQGSYTDIARGNIGADKGHKQAQESKYAKLAPQHVVAASGTTHRGRGVYFKLRADSRQVIDGDRTFSVTLRVPAQWRGELMEFRVQAEAMVQPASSAFAAITGSAPKLEQLGIGRYLVAVYLENDVDAARAARQLAKSEQSLREMATQLASESRRTFPGSKDVYVAFRLDPRRINDTPSTDKMLEMIERVLFTRIDPYFDSQIKKLRSMLASPFSTTSTLASSLTNSVNTDRFSYY